MNDSRPARRDFAALLRARHFGTLFAAHLVSNLGDWLAFLALFALAALEWRASATRIALLAVAYVVPLAVVAPLAGVVVDRTDLRRVLVASDLARALLVAAMAFTSSYAALAALLFLHQSCGCFFNPAQSAALPRLVERERLLAANALTSGAGHASKILGPAVAGLLVAAFGARGCFLADAASFLLSAVALATLPAMPPIAAATRRRLGSWRDTVRELQDGWTFLRGTTVVRDAVVLVAVTMVALGGFVALLAQYARDRLGADARAMGLLLSTLGLGAICGALAVAHLGRRRPRLHAVLVGMLVLAAALALLSRAGTLPLAYAGVLLLGAAAACVVVPAQALLQEETPPVLLGRVTSSAIAIIGLAQATSMALAGPTSSWLGLQRWLGGAALLLVLTVAAWLAGATRAAATARRA